MSTNHATRVDGFQLPAWITDAVPASTQEVTVRDERPEQPEVLEPLLDARGYKRPKATLPGYHKGRVPKTKGRTYGPTPPTVNDVSALLRACPDTPAGRRLYTLIIVLYRSGLRISEALALTEHDLDERRQTIEVRRGKGGKARTVVMDQWAWDKIRPWLEYRKTVPIGPIFCVLYGPTRGTRVWSHTDVRRDLKKLAIKAGVRKRIAPHQFRHACAIFLHEHGVDVFVIAKMLGHSRTEVTALYLSAVSPRQMLQPVINMPPPMVEL